MKLFSLLLFSIVINTTIYSQQVTLITNLNNAIKETSGLITINQKLITHNDSGGEPALYEIDSITGNFTRKVIIRNASNNDWEDICSDSLYIYIGDFGNNSGARTNLKIYRLLISDYLTTPNDTVSADSINFSYADQTDFTPTTYSTNFDAEAIVVINDSLYIFTKNWGNGWTNIYALPKTPGTYSTSRIDSLNAQGLITGSTYDVSNNSIGLIGYTPTTPFFIKISQFSGNQFSNGTVTRNVLTVPASFQVESITPINQNEYYLTAEENSTDGSCLYRLFNQPTGIDDIISPPNYTYPNPVSNILHLKFNNLKSAQLFNLSGVKTYKTNANIIDVSNIKKGIYIIKLTNIDNKIVYQKLLIN